MKPPGTYKIRSQRRREAGNGYDGAAPLLPQGVATEAGSGADGFLEQLARSEHRIRRIIDSLRNEILAGGGGSNLRIRQIFRTPREIYRLELELPALGYQRTTLLDRDALEELLEADEVRACVESASLGG